MILRLRSAQASQRDDETTIDTAHETRRTKKGSILIWTVLLGMLLTSVFFFVAVRLGAIGGKQLETMEYQNQKAYFESYVDYLMAKPSEGAVGLDEIDVTLTKSVDEITGSLDSGESEDYVNADVANPASVKVEYNICQGPSSLESANIETDPVQTAGPATQPCGSFDYANYMLVTVPISGTLTITSADAPFHYRITSQGDVNLQDDLWHLSAEMRVGFGKRFQAEEVF